MPTAENLIPQLESACNDLLWRSETDAPFEILCWELPGNRLDPHDLLYRSGQPLDTPTQVVSLKGFFEPVILDRSWHDSTEQQLVQRYRNLKDLLETALENLQVYRLGEMEVTVYLLGWTEDGKIVGVKTMVVET
jgi:hypothetical protein